MVLCSLSDNGADFKQEAGVLMSRYVTGEVLAIMTK